MAADFRETDQDNKDPETYEVIGAAMEVHSELGQGFLEAVYHDALEKELKHRSIQREREYPLPVSYKGELLGTPYRADFLCYDSVIVEIKAIKVITDIETAQVLNYLKASGLSRALLINFGTPKLQYRRLVNHF
jgi:GxxExxY protein